MDGDVPNFSLLLSSPLKSFCGGGWVGGEWWSLKVNLGKGFGPNLGLALWPRAEPINKRKLKISQD